jgi:hypothetical protein
MVVVDATTLLLFFRPDAGAPTGPDGKPVKRTKERVEFLISRLTAARTRVLVPTPALSEILVRAGERASAQIVEVLEKQQVFRIEGFGKVAALELASMLRKDFPPGKKRVLGSHETWAKLKFDRQIVAIAAVAKAEIIYSDDGDIRAIAKRNHIEVKGIADLPLPPEDPNLNLFEDSDRQEE